MSSTSVKQMVEVKIGSYSMMIDEEKMGILESTCNGSSREYQQIQEMTDWLIDMCCSEAIGDAVAMKYIKYLKNIRGVFDYLKSIEVTKEK